MSLIELYSLMIAQMCFKWLSNGGISKAWFSFEEITDVPVSKARIYL